MSPFELGRRYAATNDRLPHLDVRKERLGSWVAAFRFGDGFNAAKMEDGFFNLIDFVGEGEGVGEWWQ